MIGLFGLHELGNLAHEMRLDCFD